jgi:hypothetical protein
MKCICGDNVLGLYHDSGSLSSSSHHGDPGAIPGQVHMRFVVDALGQIVPKAVQLSPCQYHSTSSTHLFILLSPLLYNLSS